MRVWFARAKPLDEVGERTLAAQHIVTHERHRVRRHLEIALDVDIMRTTEQGLDTLKKRWTEVMKDVHEIAEVGKVDEVYPKNHEFWRESFQLAQTLDLFNELPSKLDIAWDVTKTLPDRFADVVGKVAHAVGDVANKAAEGLTTGLGKSLLIGGSVVVGGLLLWRWIRPSPTAAA